MATELSTKSWPVQDNVNPKHINFVMPKNRDGRKGKSGPIYEFDGATQTFRAGRGGE